MQNSYFLEYPLSVIFYLTLHIIDLQGYDKRSVQKSFLAQNVRALVPSSVIDIFLSLKA